MILSVSENNIETIEGVLSQHKCDTIFVVDYADDLVLFLDFIIGKYPEIKQIHCFTEKKPTAFLGGLEDYDIDERPWRIAEYKAFFKGGRADFSGHMPLYDGDESRIKNWQKLYAMGPFAKVADKVRRVIPFEFVSRFTDIVFIILGLLFQLIVPFLRKNVGQIKLDYKGVGVTIFYDDGPAKDHYGESPMLDIKIEAFTQAVRNSSERGTCQPSFFIVCGPRHEYIGKILDMEDQGDLGNFSIFATSLYRPKPCEVTERRKTGFFSKGTNVTIKGKRIYSDHCLSVGAGDKELWSYLGVAGKDVQ